MESAGHRKIECVVRGFAGGHLAVVNQGKSLRDVLNGLRRRIEIDKLAALGDEDTFPEKLQQFDV